MSFPRYPAYKDSGVEWLGEVPEHWEEKPLKTVTSINDEVLPESVNTDHEIEYVDISSVSLAKGIERTETMSFGDAPSRARRIPRDGDVLVSTVRTYLKAIAPVISLPSNLVTSTGFAVIRPKPGIHPGYLKYALQEEHFIQQVISRSTGVSYPAINASDIARITLSLPSQFEQLAIANFLDRETAKIDALIAEQQRLKELLQEKRQAVISHAVTKGLNPNAPMKDSGVEWLGEVPEHWKVLPVRRCLEARNNLRTPIDVASRLEMEGDYPYYGPTGILSHIDRFMVEGEHFLIGEDGDHFLKFEKLPMSLLVSGRFNVNNHAHLLRGGPFCLTEWGALFFEHKDLQPWLIKQGVGRYKLRKEKLMEIPMTIPPLDEQRKILDSAEVQRTTSAQAVTKCLEMTELLQERRSALISAAVTGQIDVRGLVLEASEQ